MFFLLSGCKYFFMLCVIFCLLKYFQPIFTIGTFWKFLYNYEKTTPVKATNFAQYVDKKHYELCKG